MHPQRIAVAIAAGVATICTFTPWVDPRWLRAARAGDLENLRWFVLVFCVALLVGMVAVRRTESLTPGGMGLCRIVGGLTTIIAILAIVGLNSKLDDLPFGRSVSVSPMLYLMLMAGVAIAVLPNVVPARSGTQS